MPDHQPDDDGQKPPVPSGPCGGSATDLPVKMTLEDIIELTGEMAHLEELVKLSLDRQGMFTSTEAYLSAIHPILDLLEVEIRVRYRPGMSKNEMKLVVQDWIDGEIRKLRKKSHRT